MATARAPNLKQSQLDTKEWDVQLEELEQQISDHNSRINNLKQEIDKKNGGRAEFQQAKADIQTALQDLDDKINKLEEDRKRIRESIQETNAHGRELKREANAMKSKLGFGSEREIDDEIAKIEYKMSTNTFSLRDEKKLMQQIKELKNSKPMLSQYHRMEANTASDSLSTEPLKNQMDTVSHQLKELKDRRSVHRDKLTRLKEKRTKATEGVETLVNEKNCLEAEIKELFKKKKEINMEKQKRQREHNQKIMERQKATLEKTKAEKAVKEVERQMKNLAWELDHVEDEIPYAFESYTAEQAIAYTKRLIAVAAVEEPKEDVTLDMSEITEGAVILKAKKDRDADYFCAPTKGKKKKKELKKEEKGGGKLHHTLDTLSCYQKLDVKPPMTYEDVPECLKQLEEKLDDFKEKQKEAVADLELRRTEIQNKIESLNKAHKEKSAMLGEKERAAIAATLPAAASPKAEDENPVVEVNA